MRVPARRDPRQQPHLGAHPAGPRDPPQRGGQHVVADEGGRPGRPPVVGQVADPYGLYGYPRVQRGLERGPPEGPLGASAPGGALGIDGDAVAVDQSPGEGVDGGGQGAQPVALDVEGAGLPGERPEDRPAPDVALGQHPGGQDGGDERDVQPGDVVGDDQPATAGAGRPVHGDPQAEGAQQGGGPGPYHPVPGPLRQQPQRRGAQDSEQDQGDGAGETQYRARHAHRAPLVAGAGLGSAGRGREPGAHAAGASARKCLR